LFLLRTCGSSDAGELAIRDSADVGFGDAESRRRPVPRPSAPDEADLPRGVAFNRSAGEGLNL
jgi:hypothetical protein